MLTQVLALVWALNVNVDQCNTDIDTCYVVGTEVFRAGTSLVAQHGLLVSQNDTLRKLDSMNASIVGNMSERIRLSDLVSAKQDSVIKIQASTIKSTRIRSGLIGGALGFISGVVISLALVLVGS